MFGTLQSERLSGIDGEHMMSVVRGSSIPSNMVPVDSTISNSESSSQFVMPFCTNLDRPAYIMATDNLFKNEVRRLQVQDPPQAEPLIQITPTTLSVSSYAAWKKSTSCVQLYLLSVLIPFKSHLHCPQHDRHLRPHAQKQAAPLIALKRLHPARLCITVCGHLVRV